MFEKVAQLRLSRLNALPVCSIRVPAFGGVLHIFMAGFDPGARRLLEQVLTYCKATVTVVATAQEAGSCRTATASGASL